MANVLIEETTMTAIADAIRAKTGDTDLILPSDMPTQIESISSGGATDEEITSLKNQVYGLAVGKCEYVSGKKNLLDLTTIMTPDGLISGGYSDYAMAGMDCVYARAQSLMSLTKYTFGYCKKLKIFDVSPVETFTSVWFAPTCFYGSTALESLIVRVQNADTKIFLGLETGSAAANLTQLDGINDSFYIYVSSVCYDTTVSTNPKYSGRIRKLEDYPAIDNWYENTYGSN